VISKTNGKLVDTVTLSAQAIESLQFRPLGKVPTFTWKAEKDNTPKIAVEKFGSNIRFVDLKHCSARALVVEFADYLLVAEAPLTIANGECIIAEAKKIAPEKPIRYFVFNHFHNWYLGGIRPFIHAGATILTIPQNRPYLEYIASCEHTLAPDSLQLDPKPLKIEAIGDGIRVGDGKSEMIIYHIGKKSDHTYDYLVYYFPAEKMLFQGDLVWINKSGPLVKAGPRQAGLYKAIRDLELDVRTVVQSWPLEDYNVKSVIDFEELEQSVFMP
jgi:glyoxylase-like metal-dependent hydrolase (beta-lactamase superfamily II)